jgi:hypothetical protein
MKGVFVRPIAVIMSREGGVSSALRPIHVMASEAKPSIARQVETWIASLRSQ